MKCQKSLWTRIDYHFYCCFASRRRTIDIVECPKYKSKSRQWAVIGIPKRFPRELPYCNRIPQNGGLIHVEIMIPCIKSGRKVGVAEHNKKKKRQ